MYWHKHPTLVSKVKLQQRLAQFTLNKINSKNRKSNIKVRKRNNYFNCSQNFEYPSVQILFNVSLK